MKLRKYQQNALDAVFAAFNGGVQTTMIVLPTGGGKTIVFGHIAKEMLARGRVMILAHRGELLEQAADKLHRITSIRAEMEKAEMFTTEDHAFGKPPLVVASVQTLNSGNDQLRRLHRFDPNDFVLVVLDEGHHGPADSFKRCLDYFKQNRDCRVLLVTATPDRADERGLREICDHVAFDYELPDIINDGYLVPIRQRRVRVDGLEFAKIRNLAGDFDQGELEAAMLAEKPLHGVAHATIEQACGFEIGYLETIRDFEDRADRLRDRMDDRLPRKTLLFTVSVSHAERLAEILERWMPGSAKSVSGAMPLFQRQMILEKFRTGEIRFLCNCMIATEGFDEPSIELIVCARPTKSRPLYAQMIGRGTRPAQDIAHALGELEDASARRKRIAESVKPRLDVLDFTGNCGRHKLVSVADLLGVAKPQEILDRAAEIAEEEAVDMSDAIAQAEDEANVAAFAQSLFDEEQAERADAEDEQRVSADAMRRLQVVATADYSMRNVDGFDHSQREAPSNDPAKASPKQVSLLCSLGADSRTAANFTRKQAGAVIDKLMAKRGTNNQRWKLRTLGYSNEEIERLNFHECSAAIGAGMRRAGAA